MTAENLDCRHGFLDASCPLCSSSDFDQGTEPSEAKSEYSGRTVASAIMKLQDVGNATAQQKESVFLESLESVERVLQLRKHFDDCLGRGTFGITQAKYSLGQGRVGSAQYPSSIEATARIKVSAGDLPDLQLAAAGTGCSSGRSEPSEGSPGPRENTATKPPLKWFGVVVPPPLRAAQTDFAEALRIATLIANEHIAIHRAVSALVNHGSDEA